MRGRRTKLILILCAFLGLLAPSVARADRLRVFAETDFKGADAVFRDPVPNLATVGVPSRISSARVMAGRWLICAGPNFSSDCVWLAHDVPSFPDVGFTQKPGSLRPQSVPVMERHWGNKRAAPRTALALFERSGYDGEWTALSDSVPDFDEAHLKSPGSIVLGEGVWRLCSGPAYTGRCLILTGSVWSLQEIFLGQFRSAQRHAPGTIGWATTTGATTPPPAQPPASLKCRARKVPTQVKNKAGKLTWRCTKPTT